MGDTMQAMLYNVLYRNGRAFLQLFNGEHTFFIEDPFDHLPHFLSLRLPRNTEPVVNAKRVKLWDPLTGQWRKLWDIAVRRPSDVPKLRDEHSYEADIRYTRRYVYDTDMVPGGVYEVRGNTVRKKWKNLEELYEQPVLIPKRFAAFDIEVLPSNEDIVPSPEKAEDPVITVAVSDGKRTLVFTHREYFGSDKTFDTVNGIKTIILDSERQMLEEVFSYLIQFPVVITYHGDGFDFPYLQTRAERLGIKPPIERRSGDWFAFTDGIHVDLFTFFSNTSIQNYTFGGKYKDYGLDDVARALLGKGKTGKGGSVASMSPEEVIVYNANDAALTAELFMHKDFLPWKTLVILARIAKMSVGEVNRTSISTWIYSALAYQHVRDGYLIPRREDLKRYKGTTTKSRAKIKGKRYQGADVIDPTPGIYRDIWVFDFASLYPTVIVEKNLSYETVNPLFPCEKVEEVPEVGHRVCLDNVGIQSKFVKILRDLRVKKYKRLAKDRNLSPEQREFYNALQMTLKVIINGTYGVFGAEIFPLYVPAVAESVTAYGRVALRKARELAERRGWKVIYGDTDSLFIEGIRSKEEAEEFVREVREKLGFDIEIDKKYKLLLLSLKKNYVGFYEDGSYDIKGMVGKKVNTPEHFRQVFSTIVERIAEAVRSGEDLPLEEVREILRKGLTDILTGKVEPEKLAKADRLEKDPEGYKQRSPHVQAALYMRRRGKRVEAGQRIRYVKTTRGYVPVDFVKSSKELDLHWYAERYKATMEQLAKALGVSVDVLGARKTSLMDFLKKG